MPAGVAVFCCYDDSVLLLVGGRMKGVETLLFSKLTFKVVIEGGGALGRRSVFGNNLVREGVVLNSVVVVWLLVSVCLVSVCLGRVDLLVLWFRVVVA